VIGGGISGLAAAHALADRAPHTEIMLLEAAGRLGGVLKTTNHDGFLIEAAADGFVATATAAVDVCRRVGLGDSLIETDTPRRQAFVVHSGRLKPVPSGFQVVAPSQIRPILATRVLSARGKIRAALEYFIPRRTSEEDESLASFVRRRFGREMFDRLVQPLVGGISAADLNRLSIDATLPRFRVMERRYGSVTRAAMRQRREQISDDSSGPRYGQFVALRGGMSSLVQALDHALPPGSVQLASPVDRIARSDGGRWLLSIGSKQPRCAEVDCLILATPAQHGAGLLAGVDSCLARQLADIEYASCAVVSLAYRRSQIEHALDGFGFVVPLIEQRNFYSCSFSSVKYAGRAPEGAVLLRVFIGGACQRGLMRLSTDDLMELASLEVAELLEIRGKPILRHLTRQHLAIPQYHVGHPMRVAAINERLSRFPTLALVGSAYGGVGVPACIQSGQAAAMRILSRLRILSCAGSAPSVRYGAQV
jgi:oxygen-dependent protoporphyrinogen oxidase